MCGIGGWLGNITDGRKYASRMVRSLHHRGPDGQGIRVWPSGSLVHTRLSIIDRSPSGAQPIPNEDESIWAVVNGEIYNHQEIRKTLELKGHQFRGHSDSEVIPHLYEEEGVDFVKKLRGMFALAIFDLRNQTLLLVRDRFGIKPLFYAECKNCMVFASEINAILENPEIDVSPDPQAIFDFVALLYIPAPETFYKGIRALQPGEMLEATFKGDEILTRKRIYHRWNLEPDFGMQENFAVKKAEELIATAVGQQLESEVPLGALLSGGIDSSLISVAAQKALQGKLRTFNLQFRESEYDETWAALDVAKHIGSFHQMIKMDQEAGNWDDITSLLLHTGQPYADSSIFAANAICRLMANHVTVALSGDGGDEGFGGYNFYHQAEDIIWFQKFPKIFWTMASQVSIPLAQWGVVPKTYPIRLRELVRADDSSILQTLFCWIREEEHKLLCPEIKGLPIRRLFEPQWEHNFPERISRVERLSACATEANVRLALANDYLFKVDLASMREGLEIRVPLLDEDLFSFGLSLPHRLKVKKKIGKWVLRSVANRQLPRSVAQKPKWGFCVPVDAWVNDAFRERLRETLLNPKSRLREFLNQKFYQSIVESFCDKRPHPDISRHGLYQRVIMLLSLHIISEHCSRSPTSI